MTTSNVQRVLGELMSGPPLTVNELAARLGLPRAAVANTVHGLVCGGRLHSLPGPERRGAMGRPALCYTPWMHAPAPRCEQTPAAAQAMTQRALAARSALEMAWSGMCATGANAARQGGAARRAA